ncbi:MAG: hypothetical protein KDE51_26040 [Anaerolineales bacterium]|nr:hypothetical protein [Anaerolineales bacterium]
MERVQQVLRTANQISQSEEFEQFMINAQDFVSQREQSGDSISTQLSQAVVTLSDAAEVLNRSFTKSDSEGRPAKVISPVVMPKSHRSWGWVAVALGAAVFGIIVTGIIGAIVGGGNAVGDLVGAEGSVSSIPLLAPFWLLWVGYVAFHLWKNSFVMIPDGCIGLITKFGKVEADVGPGRHWIFHPRKRVGYIVNVTKEYPYNAPIREAPTKERVHASVDLFLQFRIRDPRKFIFSLGGVNGFSEKLQNAISEVTRALIYEQKAEDIYDLVGESTRGMLVNLNQQFSNSGGVEFTNANITHAEPSSREYRMDLAAAEMVRVAKEAYTYEYELDLRKKKDEGDLEKDLADLRKRLSEIRAEIATYRAQMETAHEKEINRANAYAQQLMIEAESGARANAALLQAQALDIRSVQSAYYPELLEYRFKQQILDRMESVADQLPQVINMGDDAGEHIDFLAVAQKMLGVQDKPLYSPEDLERIRGRVKAITERVKQRHEEIRKTEMAIDTDQIALDEEVVEA